MKSRLRHELHQFLERERISLESDIVNDFTYQLAGIDVTPTQRQEGFYFTTRWRQDTEKEAITFSIPERFSMTQIKKLMGFFNLAEETYQHKASLVLNDQYIFEVFVPRFKQFFQEMQEKSPENIAKYRISSAPILESTARSTLSKYIEETRKIVLSDNLKELTPVMKSLIDFMILLSGRMSALERFPLFYKDILSSRDTLHEFLQVQEIKGNEDLSKQLRMILEGMALYARYHRTESVLGNIAFRKEFDLLLAFHRISAKECDLLEHTVLALAGAEIYPKSRCQFSAGNNGLDAARFVIKFNDINQENTNKVLDYMRIFGDETAHEGSGYRQYGSAMEMAVVQECALDGGQPQSALFHMPYDKKPALDRVPEMHSIEVDGKFFYERIFPQVKEKIEQMAAQNLLGSYQELSKALFKQPKETTPVSALGMFSRSDDSPMPAAPPNSPMPIAPPNSPVPAPEAPHFASPMSI